MIFKAKSIVTAMMIFCVISFAGCTGESKEANAEAAEKGASQPIQQWQALRLATDKMIELGLLKNEMDYTITAKKSLERKYWYFRVIFLPETVDHEFTVRVTFDGQVSVGR